MKKLRSRNGFTLIELIIYIGISTIVLVALLRVMLTITGTRERLETVSIVQQEGRYVMHRLTTVIHSAVAINEAASVFDVDNGVLSLEMQNPAMDPTIITLVSSGVYLQEGLSAPQALTSSGVQVDQLRFVNRSAPDTRGTVSILLHIIDNRAGDTADYTDDITLQTSVTLRP